VTTSGGSTSGQPKADAKKKAVKKAAPKEKKSKEAAAKVTPKAKKKSDQPSAQ
jgi:hypothetical protein